MRVQLKHVLPLALLLTGVAAKTTTEASSTAVSDASTTASDTTATHKVTKTKDSTATDEAASTETGDSTDTNTNSKTTKAKAKSSTTTAAQDTDTWVASIQATVAPDLNGAAVSYKDPGLVVLGLAVGLMMAGTAFL
ncbi:hypothetical protein B0J13DRAFT_625898 [Dactylonectria estremocensis]|uniref:Uncharacterized protein n=1 Tax=Dactylonectria estremocensis TaxID=1079267 RepID=A0A9P9IXL3_9HYPO|nr:hypothetical protein B0J13DRAFT_625898 [Dactylonectria estremocensis]